MAFELALWTPRASRTRYRFGRARLGVGALASVAITTAGLSATGVADATCVRYNGAEVGASCPKPTRGAGSGQDGGAAARPPSTGAIPSRPTSVTGPAPSPAVPPDDVDTTGAFSDPMKVADSMLGTDTFGPYGCEDFVDAVYGLTTASGIAHDSALSFYQSLASRGLAHHEMPIPAGALVFSAGPDGEHVDISRGDGTYYSGGVQGISRGYGDGHNIQILPSPNLGAYSVHGWTYPPW